MKNTLLTIIAVLAFVNYSKSQDLNQTLAQNKEVVSSNPALKDTTAAAQVNDNSGQPATAKQSAKPPRDVPWFVEKFKVSAGFFLALANTDVKVSNKDGSIGTDINFQNDLGFNKSTGSFLGDFQWRSSSRSRFDLSYYVVDQSASYTLQKTINFGNNTYDVNSTVSSFFNTDIYRFSYGYAIISQPNYEAGLLVGAHIIRFNVGLGLTGEHISAAVSNDFGFTAPLPDFGIWGGYAFGQQWAVNGEFDYLALTIDNISGRILGYNVSATYRAIKNLSFSLGYTGFNFKIDATRKNLVGDLKWGYNGPTVSATFAFGKKSWK
ncbi:hypothetical protein HDF18_12315 [Mucilaginibacter sp. X5P1]|uniref:hypothetical protein n=1 Tax=Mucilaginibacter sp. X5P1 TaxID=2723088 RepID=UPI001620F5B3|nr:hypothetical protein [Mucilaginibacter sp. X5P1]MBB6140394.1 hypothetical protein [Mucilaginibacter sp. X5P1]